MHNAGMMDSQIIGEGSVNIKLQTIQLKLIECSLRNLSIAQSLEDTTLIFPVKLSRTYIKSKAKWRNSEMQIPGEEIKLSNLDGIIIAEPYN